MGKKKAATAEEKRHMADVVALGCIVCRRLGFGASPAEFHHLRTGAGLMRSPHKRGIPLCPAHHRTGGFGVAYHAGAKTWEANFGTELELLEQTELELIEYRGGFV